MFYFWRGHLRLGLSCIQVNTVIVDDSISILFVSINCEKQWYLHAIRCGVISQKTGFFISNFTYVKICFFMSRCIKHTVVLEEFVSFITNNRFCAIFNLGGLQLYSKASCD
jgi:hypothetical protein